MNKLIFILLIFISTSGFLPAKLPVYTGRENFFEVKKNQLLVQKINLQKDIKIIGIIFLLSVKDKTELSLSLKDMTGKVLLSINKECQPENSLKQTVKIIFNSPIDLPPNSIIEINSLQNYEIYHSSTAVSNTEQSFFYVDEQPINGSIYLELIKPVYIANIVSDFKNKFFNNSFFAYFYLIIIICLCFTTLYCFRKKNKCR